MLMLECSPPIQWKPKWWSNGETWRFLWLWFGIAYNPRGWNDFITDAAKAGIALREKGEM